MPAREGDATQYDLSSLPSVLGADETAARLAEVERHDRQKAALDRGHTLRLVLAAPIVVWTLALMAAVIVLVAVPLLQALFGAGDDFSVDGWLVAFAATVALAEVAAIWAALILIRDVVRSAAWSVISGLSAAALAGALTMLAVAGEAQQVDVIAVAAMAYVLVVALAQLRRSRRLRGIVEDVERWYP